MQSLGKKDFEHIELKDFRIRYGTKVRIEITMFMLL
jgi:hypothetical protein